MSYSPHELTSAIVQISIMMLTSVTPHVTETQIKVINK
jgi:hypothetical protein